MCRNTCCSYRVHDKALLSLYWRLGGVSPTGKSFRFVCACDAKPCGRARRGLEKAKFFLGLGSLRSKSPALLVLVLVLVACLPLWWVRLWSGRVLSRGSGAFSRGSGMSSCAPTCSGMILVRSGVFWLDSGAPRAWGWPVSWPRPSAPIVAQAA